MQHGIETADGDKVWLRHPSAYHAGCPRVPGGEIAPVTDGVETDMLSLARDDLTPGDLPQRRRPSTA